MKAMVYTQYGGPEVLHLQEVDKPVPKDDEVLIKIHAASVNAADWHLLRADPFLVRFMGTGFLKPKNTILGADVAGIIEAVGKNVKQFHPGDEVFGDLAQCGWGSFAEFTCAKEGALVLKPANLSFKEAAAVPLAAVTALKGLRDMGRVQRGQKVAINGASGGVGTFAVQIAKAYGAEVTAVCSSRNLELVKTLGADRVIDYTKEDFTAGGEQYDCIFAANGYHPITHYKRALLPGGVYVMAGGAGRQMFQSLLYGPVISMTGNKKMTSVMGSPNQSDLTYLKELIERGKVKPVIDRVYPLEQADEAVRYIDEGHARGKVVITM